MELVHIIWSVFCSIFYTNNQYFCIFKFVSYNFKILWILTFKINFFRFFKSKSCNFGNLILFKNVKRLSNFNFFLFNLNRQLFINNAFWNFIPNKSKSNLFLSNMPHNIIHIDKGFLIIRQQINRPDTAQMSQFIIIKDHHHHGQVCEAMNECIIWIKITFISLFVD